MEARAGIGQSFAGDRARMTANGFRFGLRAITIRAGLIAAGWAGADLRLIRLGGSAWTIIGRLLTPPRWADSRSDDQQAGRAGMPALASAVSATPNRAPRFTLHSG